MLTGFWIDPLHRGNGLSDFMMDHFNGLGLKDVWLFVHEDNKIAIHIYSKHGFKYDHTDERFEWWHRE